MHEGPKFPRQSFRTDCRCHRISEADISDIRRAKRDKRSAVPSSDSNFGLDLMPNPSFVSGCEKIDPVTYLDHGPEP
jgi:hypothetical protein